MVVDVNSLVSMNMWGLTPDFLDVLEEGFNEFFEKEVPGNPLKAEYLIPIFIPKAEFSGYIDALVRSQLISEYQDDGITYYNVTDKGVDWLKNQSRRKDWLSLVGTGASVVSAVSAAIPLISII